MKKSIIYILFCLPCLFGLNACEEHENITPLTEEHMEIQQDSLVRASCCPEDPPPCPECD